MSFGDRFTGRDGPVVPFGRAGVAAVLGAALALIGLLLPTSLLQSVAFQLYLDTIFPAAVPPFGWLAHVIAALVLGVVGAGIGLLLARLFAVQSGHWTMVRLINRLRGIGQEDDADAPTLRSADRHPDAPARRPFSAATDIPGRDQADHWSVRAVGANDAHDDDRYDEPFDDDGELLLDGQFVDLPQMTPDSALEDPVAVPVDGGSADALAPAVTTRDDDEAPLEMTTELTADEAMLFDELALDDGAGEAGAHPESPAAALIPEPADPVSDRLDVLLARLEAGLSARGEGTSPSAAAPATPHTHSDDATPDAPRAPGDAVVPPPVAVNDAGVENNFPNDPALAAALATLRRMNQHVG